MICVTFTNDQGALVFAFVIIMGDFSGCGQGAFRWNGGMKDQTLLPMKNSGQIHIGGDSNMSQKVKNSRNRKAGQHFQLLFVTVFQFGKPGTHAQCIQHGILPGIVPGYGADGFSQSIQIQSHRATSGKKGSGFRGQGPEFNLCLNENPCSGKIRISKSEIRNKFKIQISE